MHDSRAKHAVNGRRRPEAHCRIEIIEAETSGPAVGVGDAGLHADTVAGLELRDLGARFDYDAGRLMAENLRLADDERADRAVGVVMDVAAAHADGAECNSQVARSERLLEGKVPQREFQLFFQYQCLHGKPPLLRSAHEVAPGSFADQ